MIHTGRVLRLVRSTPWSILPDKLEEIVAIVEDHAAGVRLTHEEIRARIGSAPRPEPSMAGSVAVLPLRGVVAQRANVMTEISGGTSTERLGAMLAEYVRDPEISAVVLDVDSPGVGPPFVDEERRDHRAHAIADHEARLREVHAAEDRPVLPRVVTPRARGGPGHAPAFVVFTAHERPVLDEERALVWPGRQAHHARTVHHGRAFHPVRRTSSRAHSNAVSNASHSMVRGR